jgi:hypothetical protein
MGGAAGAVPTGGTAGLGAGGSAGFHGGGGGPTIETGGRGPGGTSGQGLTGGRSDVGQGGGKGAAAGNGAAGRGVGGMSGGSGGSAGGSGGGTAGAGGTAVGTGGSSGVGGAPLGSGGAVGTGGAPPPACLPTCLTELAARCPTTGQCQATMPLPTITSLCWSNGSTADRTTMSSTRSVSSVTNVYGANGPCYSLEISDTVPATMTAYVWRRPNGDLVADGSSQGGNPTLFTVRCDGMAHVVDTTSSPCQGKAVVPTCAIGGTCP